MGNEDINNTTNTGRNKDLHENSEKRFKWKKNHGKRLREMNNYSTTNTCNKHFHHGLQDL